MPDISSSSSQRSSASSPEAKTSISPSEWEVLNIVWKTEPVTAAEVIDRLPAHLQWHPKTVGTFLTRLVDKCILTAEKRGKANVYRSRVTREQCVAAESENFLQRVFRGATKPLLTHFAERADLTEEDIAELKALLDQRKQHGNRNGKGDA